MPKISEVDSSDLSFQLEDIYEGIDAALEALSVESVDDFTIDNISIVKQTDQELVFTVIVALN